MFLQEKDVTADVFSLALFLDMLKLFPSYLTYLEDLLIFTISVTKHACTLPGANQP